METVLSIFGRANACSGPGNLATVSEIGAAQFIVHLAVTVEYD